MKNILMYGPAIGHNSKSIVEYLNHSSQYKLTYLYKGRNDFITNKNVTFVPVDLSPRNLYRLIKVVRKQYDLIWINGGGSLLFVLFIVIFKHGGSKMNLYVWGESVPQRIVSNSLYGRLYRFTLGFVDYVQCGWYGTYNILKNKISSKIVVFPGGLEKSIFEEQIIEEPSLEAKEFVEMIANKKSFFYPKTINNAAGHELIIEASKKLVDQGYKGFLVVFWMGNGHNLTLINHIKSLIDKYNLGSYILMQKHSFLSFQDMKFIWEHIDVGLQIAKKDQLSSTLLEPMLLKKPVIASKIEAYVIYEKKFNINLDLCPLNADAIANEMKLYLEGKMVSNEELEKRKHIVWNNFQSDENLEKALKFYLDKEL